MKKQYTPNVKLYQRIIKEVGISADQLDLLLQKGLRFRSWKVFPSEKMVLPNPFNLFHMMGIRFLCGRVVGAEVGMDTGFAFCSPSDLHKFSLSEGRCRALKRLIGGLLPSLDDFLALPAVEYTPKKDELINVMFLEAQELNIHWFKPGRIKIY